MKKIIFSISAIMVLIVMVSCQKQLMTYEGKPDIYFNEAGKITNSSQFNTDSISISFSLAKGTDSVQKVIIASTGAMSSTDRSYKLEVDPASTAIVGKHYDALPTSLFIKKNRTRDTVSLKIHRTVDMQTNSYVLYLNLVANENFATEMRDKVTNAATGTKMNFIKYKIIMSDILKKPRRWSDNLMGTFTRKKLFFMCDYLNITPAYLDTSISVAEGTAFPKLIQRYLNEQKIAGKTIYEDDGSEMSMGPDAQ
ncbi:DUF4843 domain-containing protein [Pedobacter psychrodurus]|uniref:DUF4843 domain-containing protein n=1 Tax=Pedobacter psychrodurus TaxID=2530456 RepID=A0A4R0Q6N0_9SPHI|nr:DUF4843 domain-containing protein [Pedobacter psychrodurus]TCD29745.1 DUF4843 domain-containing protein [Pedobacter psychrodurus]